MGTPKACNIQSAAGDSASADLNAESASDVATACRQEISYTGDKVALREVSSAVSVISADQHSDATEYYDSRKVLLQEGIKPDDDPATADSVLATMDAETDKLERAEVGSAIVVDSADTGPHVDGNYDLPEVLLLRSTGSVFDPGGIGYSLEQAGDGETAWNKAVNSTGPKTVTEPVPAEVSWGDDKCSSTGDPMETLRQHYVAIAATEDEQKDDVDNSKTDIFERSGTDLELTDYAHELAFLPDLTEVEPTELDYSAPNVKSSSHTPALSARLVTKLQKHEGIMISSGNALPPPAYEALCDIDVLGHAPIKKKARRTPLRHLSKLYVV
ncbi:hypothetical protein PInf_009781 [Phytophthora infestans]|nr:hypothetical protein PInf_009781 [Phytophthora infestans]